MSGRWSRMTASGCLREVPSPPASASWGCGSGCERTGGTLRIISQTARERAWRPRFRSTRPAGAQRPRPAGLGTPGGHPDAVIRDHRPDMAVLPDETDLYLPRPRVARHVGQRLLHEAVEQGLEPRRIRGSAARAFSATRIPCGGRRCRCTSAARGPGRDRPASRASGPSEILRVSPIVRSIRAAVSPRTRRTSGRSPAVSVCRIPRLIRAAVIDCASSSCSSPRDAPAVVLEHLLLVGRQGGQVGLLAAQRPRAPAPAR